MTRPFLRIYRPRPCRPATAADLLLWLLTLTPIERLRVLNRPVSR